MDKSGRYCYQGFRCYYCVIAISFFGTDTGEVDQSGYLSYLCQRLPFRGRENLFIVKVVLAQNALIALVTAYPDIPRLCRILLHLAIKTGRPPHDLP